MTFIQTEQLQVLPLWPDGAPGSEHWPHQEWEDIIAPENAPPLFIACSSDDPLPVVRPCLTLYQAWWSGGHSVEMHNYAQGSHGFGMRKQGLPSDTWIDRFGDWLDAQGLLTPRRLATRR